MVLAGHIHNGVIVLDDPIPLPEGAEVHVQIVPRQPPDVTQRSLFDVLQPVIGKATELPVDASQQADHYLYGHPKQ
jgi:hypothetical protein